MKGRKEDRRDQSREIDVGDAALICNATIDMRELLRQGHQCLADSASRESKLRYTLIWLLSVQFVLYPSAQRSKSRLCAALQLLSSFLFSSLEHRCTYPVLELAISSTKISVAPTFVSSSITLAICFFSTIELTATQFCISNAVIVGARLPGVILVAVSRSARATLY